MYPCFVVEEILGMKENIGVIYDTSPQVDEVVEVLLGSLSLARQSARPVREVWGGWLCRYDVMMLVSAFWGDVFLPGEWHRFFERVGIDSFSGRTLVPVATSRPLVVSMAPVLRRLFRSVCVRVVWPAEVFFIPEGHFAEAGNGAGATRQVDEWLSVFGRCGRADDGAYSTDRLSGCSD